VASRGHIASRAYSVRGWIARDTRKLSTDHAMKLNILHLLVVAGITVAVIINYDKAVWAACCLLMGKELGNAIIDLKKP
jgi:hypothetical protein